MTKGTALRKEELLREVAPIAARANGNTETKAVVIKPPNFAQATILVAGKSPYIQNKFSSENRQKMEAAQKEGTAGKKVRRARPPKDFKKVYEGSRHVSTEGWDGIPTSSFRNAMIDACRLVEFDMIRAKMCIDVIADGWDRENGQPLVRITKGTPHMAIDRVRIGMGQTDLVARARFDEWEARVTIEWDADIFQATDVVNLLARAGRHVGIGAGRPLSKQSAGMGMGRFEVRT